MVNHVQETCEHGTPACPRGAHPSLEGEALNKECLEPGTIYCVQYVAEHISCPILSMLVGAWFILVPVNSIHQIFS